jgi:hypothetical protein
MTKKVQCLPKTDRNNAIYTMRKEGTPYKVIAFKYDISIARVFEIVKKLERQEEFRKMWNNPKNFHKSTHVNGDRIIEMETRFMPLLIFKK